jgi:hypothetical protein
MIRFVKSTLLTTAMLFMGSMPPAIADDSNADAPGGFADQMNRTRGVVLRVPINARGEENTDSAEIRFFQRNEPVTKATNPGHLWNSATRVKETPEVMGTNIPAGSDSSTFGWFVWHNFGWMYPYYYYRYYPTYYYYGNYWYYNYYWNWNWYGYRYYYYNYWW